MPGKVTASCPRAATKVIRQRSRTVDSISDRSAARVYRLVRLRKSAEEDLKHHSTFIEANNQVSESGWVFVLRLTGFAKPFRVDYLDRTILRPACIVQGRGLIFCTEDIFKHERHGSTSVIRELQGQRSVVEDLDRGAGFCVCDGVWESRSCVLESHNNGKSRVMLYILGRTRRNIADFIHRQYLLCPQAGLE